MIKWDIYSHHTILLSNWARTAIHFEDGICFHWIYFILTLILTNVFFSFALLLPLLYFLFTLVTLKGSGSDCRRWIWHTLRLAEIRWMSPASLRWCDVTDQLFIFIFVKRKTWRFECTLNRILWFSVETRDRDICYWNYKCIIPCFNFFFVFFFF